MFKLEQTQRIFGHAHADKHFTMFDLLKKILKLFKQSQACHIDPLAPLSDNLLIAHLQRELHAVIADPIKSVQATNKLNLVVKQRYAREIDAIRAQIQQICSEIYEEHKSAIVSRRPAVNNNCIHQLSALGSISENFPTHVLFFIQLPAKLTGIEPVTGTAALIAQFKH